MNCPRCNFESPAGLKFCVMCGAALTRACSRCGFDNFLTYRFCGMCGQQLTASEAGEGQSAPGLLQLPGEAVQPAAPPSTEPPMGGERRVVTVILSDIAGSTSLLERVGNEAWVELMNRVLHIQENEVERFGGKVDQYRGDGLVAFFGANLAHEDDPERAVIAALSMQETVQAFARTLAKDENVQLRLRVGVNTGEVIVSSGNGGGAQAGEDSVMGMAISIAARMENAAQPDTVLVSEYTYRLVADRFEWQSLGKIMVRGISHAIDVYRPIALRAQTELVSGLKSAGLSLPLIGRQVEFQTLKTCVEHLYDGRGGIALLNGEAGMGKSFLVNELRQYFLRQNALLIGAEGGPALHHLRLTILSGRCRSYDTSRPYSLWVDLLHNWLGANREECVKTEVTNRLRCLAEDLWGEQADDYYPYLATFLTLPLEKTFTAKIKHLDAQALHQQFLWVLRSWAARLAERQPMVLFLSDLHWADASSLEVLRFCLSLAEDQPLLWLISYRPERTALVWEFQHQIETKYPHRLTRIDLSPLTLEQCGQLIDKLVGPKTLPPETRNLVIKSTEGNPFYILEIIQSWIEAGWLAREGEMGEWRLQATVAELTPPESLRQLLRARIDRLSPETRSILQLAAVIGPVFWSNVLQALAGPKVDLSEHLSNLQRINLIQERGRVPELGMEYFFKSTLIRDAAYDSLLSGPRAAYHLQVADILDALLGTEGISRNDGLVAYHYGRGNNPARELIYTLWAAEQARDVYANSEALNACNRAYELLEGMKASVHTPQQVNVINTQLFEVLDLRCELYYRLGKMPDGDRDARMLLPLAEQMPGDPAWMVDALLRQPAVQRYENRYALNEGFEMAQKALTLAEQLGDKHRQMRSLAAVASLSFFLRRPQWQELGERALELARELEDRRTEAELLLSIGSAYGVDDLQRSNAYLAAAMKICQDLDDQQTQLHLLSALGAEYERQGDYYRLLTDFEQKRLNISREIGYRVEEGFSLMHCAQIQGLYLGDYAAGLQMAQEALQITRNMSNSLFPLLRVIQLQTLLGDFTPAHENLALARPVGEQVAQDVGRAGLALVEAILYNTEGGEESYHKALAQAEAAKSMVKAGAVSRQYQMAAQCEASAAYLALADLTQDPGQRQSCHERALQESQAALDIYQSFGFAMLIECVAEEVLMRHSQALVVNGRLSEADEYLTRAYNEMMRKYAMIPAESPFRRTFLEAIKLHREIRAAYDLNFQTIGVS